MHSIRSIVVLACLGGVALLATAPVLRAQTSPDRAADADRMAQLRRDQDEILRKAERLQGLMQRLQQRYEREGKQEQVELLRQGQEHLERSGVLREVASIRDDLAATALTEALRKQKEVVDDLERLLNILLERKSVEQLDEQLRVAGEQAASARELERRQRELQQQTRAALRSENSPAEQKLVDQLQQLAAAQRREAERNAVDAGTRRPFLESALERVKALLRQQDRLEAGIDAESAGRAADSRAREFDLGELAQRTRELAASLRDQARQAELGEAARALREQTQGSDPGAVREARDRFEAKVQDAPRQPGGPDGPMRDQEWEALREQLRAAGDGATASEREALQQLAERGEALARQRSDEAAAANTQQSARLGQDAGKLAEQLGKAPQPASPETSAAAAAREAAKQLAAAEQAMRDGKLPTAREDVDRALTALEQARQRHQQENPDASRQAAQRAAESAATAQELQNTPDAEATEQTASEQLRAAAEAQRQAEAGLEAARDRGARPDVGAATKASREGLEQARQQLEQALQAANQGGADELAAAAQRQQQLAQQAEQAAADLQQAAQAGAITPAQQQEAAEQMAKAAQQMQQAEQRLQNGQQANAANSQQQAADALQQAAEQMQQKRQLGEQQKQALAEQAKQQQDLAEDIIRLAQELKQRQNKAAERAAQQAASAAQKAKRAMEQGDADEAQQQQEQARQKLEEAAQDLEEEVDRYQDLRQEELLFRMKDELTAFLDKQRPITAQTLEAQRESAADGLSRPVRRKLNTLGDEEQELAGRLEFLVSALTEEGNLVYQTVLQASVDDLREISRRLAGRAPDPGTYTTLLQQDVERRTEDLLAALEKERQRRQEQQQQQQQQQQGKNRFSPQRERLVSLIAELEMLKKLGTDTRRATDNLRALVDARGDDTITEAEVALIQRLSHRHGEITKLFQQIKQGIEQAMQAMQEQNQDDQGGGTGR
ncbi:MAG: hypothetical protein JNM25_20080 [Planctomycetes bacterium]|nr:hypothetical protein [Planctomycetota bacterium]